MVSRGRMNPDIVLQYLGLLNMLCDDAGICEKHFLIKDGLKLGKQQFVVICDLLDLTNHAKFFGLPKQQWCKPVQW